MTTARQVADAQQSDLAGGVESEVDTQQAPSEGQVSRRQWVRGAAIVGTAAAVGAGLAACSTSSPSATAPVAAPKPGGAAPATTTATKAGGPVTAPKVTESLPPVSPVAPSAAAGNDELAEFGLGKTSSIPVGGGVVYPGHGVVVTQPTKGNFKCFSASCTHQGCTVNKVAAGLIQCPCHGARFSIVDGSVKAGPAPRGLTAQEFVIQKGEIVLD